MSKAKDKPAATYKKMLAAKPPPSAKPDPNTFEMGASDGATADSTQSQMLAVLATKTSLAALAMKGYVGSQDDLMVKDLVTELKKAGDEIVAGDLGRIERMLVRQAITLDAIFNQMAIRSSKQEYLKQMETYMRLALKAQGQARSTAEALALLKNPQPYIRQANIAQGHQQVNNSYASASGHTGIPAKPEIVDQYAHPRTGAGNSESSPNKLLEADHGQRLDTGAQGAAGRADKEMATVEAIDRA